MTGTRMEIRSGVWVLLVAGASAPAVAEPADARAVAGLAPWRAAELLTGRAVLRQLLGEVLPADRDAPIGYAPGGRPHLIGRPDVGVSITHDGTTVAAGVAVGHRIGVDVQHPPAVVEDALLRRCLRGQARDLAELPMPVRSRELAWVWTVQEACVKAAGTGFAGRPWAIDVPARASTGRWGRYRWVSLRDVSAVPLSCAFAPMAGEAR